MAELAERLPAGADEVVLGRRVSAGGRTSAFVAGRAATAADLKLLGGRLLAFFGQHEHRKLTIASAQLEVLDGFAGAEHLETRRAATARRTASAAGSPLSWPSCASAEGSRERDLDLYRYELSEIEEVAPDPPRSAPRSRRARAAAPRRGPARGGGAAPTRRWPGPRRTAAAPRRRWPQAESLLAGRGGPRPRPRRDRRAGRGAGGRARRRRARSCATTPRASRPTRRALPAIEERLEAIDRLERKHGGSVESVLAHAERCRAEIERLEGAEVRGAEAEAALAAAEARREELGEQLSAGRAEAAGPLEERVAAELERLAMAGATPARSCSSRIPTASARPGARRSSCGSLPTPGSRRRRCATRPPAASSRG